MAIGWLAVLQSVPWSDVIKNAPKVAEAAKRLWNTVAKSRSTPEIPAVDLLPTLSPEAQAIAVLEARLASAETATSDLHAQMLASSELIKALAEQNTQLIVRIESNSVRLLWLGAAITVVAIAATVALTLAIAQHGA
jgi:hypothetical protein